MAGSGGVFGWGVRVGGSGGGFGWGVRVGCSGGGFGWGGSGGGFGWRVRVGCSGGVFFVNNINQSINQSSSSRTCKLNHISYKTAFGERAFSVAGPRLWNILPSDDEGC